MSEKKNPLKGKRGKRYADALKKLNKETPYSIQDAFDLLGQVAFAKFDETVEAVFNLGVDPKHADQMVRGAVVLPHGTGKSQRIAVVAKGDKAKEAEGAGADVVGAEDLLEKISGGWLEFDRLIATPDMMISLSKLGKVLGPKGLMPNPKLGTVTMDVAKAVNDQKKGKVEYRTEKNGIVHVPIGKKSFGAEKLKENFCSLLGVILKAKPTASKGTYLERISISTTMSPSLTIDPNDASSVAGA